MMTVTDGGGGLPAACARRGILSSTSYPVTAALSSIAFRRIRAAPGDPRKIVR